MSIYPVYSRTKRQHIPYAFHVYYSSFNTTQGAASTPHIAANGITPVSFTLWRAAAQTRELFCSFCVI